MASAAWGRRRRGRSESSVPAHLSLWPKIETRPGLENPPALMRAAMAAPGAEA